MTEYLYWWRYAAGRWIMSSVYLPGITSMEQNREFVNKLVFAANPKCASCDAPGCTHLRRNCLLGTGPDQFLYTLIINACEKPECEAAARALLETKTKEMEDGKRYACIHCKQVTQARLTCSTCRRGMFCSEACIQADLDHHEPVCILKKMLGK
jgi:hypothetical protein